MKNIYKIALILTGSIALASCSKHEALDFKVEKPATFAAQEQINSFNPLKSYVDRQAHPGFKLGAAVSLSDYVSKGLMTRLINSNFDEITLGYEMKHGAVVQANGDLALKSVEQLIAAAKDAGISIYGHTLAWHSNQNATYLNKLIAPIVTASTGPTWDLVTGVDFETDAAPNYETSARVVKSFTVAGEGFNGVGRAIKMTNASILPNDYDAQFFLKFSPAVVAGEKYELSMKIRSDANASFSTQAHVTPGAYKFYDFFGTLSSTPVWTTYTKEITVTADMATSGAIAFNLGKTATSYYFDNITLKKYNEKGGQTTVEKTAEQKKTLITAAMDSWIKGMVTATKGYVKVWDVVNEPMDDGKPAELKTGVGRTNLAADEFYWQDYMGKDYAVKAFQLARQYGNATDIHFINDYNLEYNLDKCRGLINYVAYIEKNGAKVDGIGTQMHIDSKLDKSKIDEMFRLLAATGKLVKVSELDMGISGKKTPVITAAEYVEQKEMYRYVVEKYFEIIPKAQQYGICIWSPLDSQANSSWRAGEPIGLWTEGFVRKPAYVGVVEGLSKK